MAYFYTTEYASAYAFWRGDIQTRYTLLLDTDIVRRMGGGAGTSTEADIGPSTEPGYTYTSISCLVTSAIVPIIQIEKHYALGHADRSHRSSAGKLALRGYMSTMCRKWICYAIVSSRSH